MNTQISEGDKAPDFTLLDKDGKEFRLSEHIGKKNIVLFFYPKNFTGGCTAEACSFRDSYEEFKSAGAEVIGISSDDAASHQDFAREYRLPFVLLSDTNGAVAKRYGLKKNLLGIKGRVTFLIDKKGIVRYTFDSLILATMHVSKTLEMLQKL